MTTRIVLINRALLRIGAIPIQSDIIPGSEQHVAVYDGVVERLAADPWTFLKTTRRLVQLATAPLRGWLYAYQLPPEMLGGPRAVYADQATDQPLTTFDIEGDQLLCNQPQVWLVFTRFDAVARWPGDFRELVTLALMAEYALSVREDRALHDRLYAKAFGTPAQNGRGGLYAAALENDSQGVPATTVGGGANPLIDVRF